MSVAPKVTGYGLKQTRARDYVIILETLEFTFTRTQLEQITKDWNAGTGLDLLVEKYNRPEDEIFLALFHQARHRKIKRPIGRRLNGT